MAKLVQVAALAWFCVLILGLELAIRILGEEEKDCDDDCGANKRSSKSSDASKTDDID